MMTLLVEPSMTIAGVREPRLNVPLPWFLMPFVMLTLLEIAPFCRKNGMPPCEEQELTQTWLVALMLPLELLKFTNAPLIFTTEPPPMKRGEPAVTFSW